MGTSCGVLAELPLLCSHIHQHINEKEYGSKLKTRSESPVGSDAERRRDYGRDNPRTGSHRRGSRCLCCDGFGKDPSRHSAEAQILQAIEIDYIDESEVLSPADNIYHIDKTKFDVPFVCGAKNLGEALRRIAEGATMIRTKGEPGTGDVVQAVSHMRLMQSEIRRLVSMSEDELYEAAKQLQAPYELVRFVHDNGKLPVVNFAAGGVATPADAALMMQLGAEGVFVGSGIFKSGNPAKRAAAIVQAVTNYQDAKLLAELSEDLGEAMVGINEQEIELLMAERGK